ncbi:apolipoprotein L6-like [Thunnus thynnus]|uniref:apolipoprotein L6-like n=1 Tax=Thunnus thynnus TaxID=8237 RepID=UPI0035288AA1
MSAERGNLQKALCRYTKDTFSYINTLIEFSEKLPEWINERKTELKKVIDIKDRGDSKKREKLEQELAAVLEDTLGGLKKLDCFLDAVERLAVTSLHVFNEENWVLHLPQEIRLGSVQDVINAARLVCPLLLNFKRDAKAFFLPKLQNVKMLEYQLNRYIQTTQEICDKLEESSFSEFPLKTNMETVVDLNVDLSEDDIQEKLCHIKQLNKIRMDQHFRMVFLFEEESRCHFIKEFDERQPRMLKFLHNLEESADQLDRMDKGAKISSVTGSSVGLIGGIFSLAGLALIPVTAGVSFPLAMTGVGLGVTRGVNSAVTRFTKIGVNHTYKKKAREALQSLMKDVQSLQDCLEEMSSQRVTNMKVRKKYMAMGEAEVFLTVCGAGKGTQSFADAASAMKMLESEDLIAKASEVVAQEGKMLGDVPNVVSDIPDVGEAAVNGPLALSDAVRAGSIALNALFIVKDIYTIIKGSISLAKGSKTEFLQFIRARAALCSSEMDSWQKIRGSLRKGLMKTERRRAILDKPFKLKMEIKKYEKQKWNFHLMKWMKK